LTEQITTPVDVNATSLGDPANTTAV
jgi:hypothetical protein